MSVPFGSDPWLDARLRNVPLPAGMLARLNQLGKDAAESQESADGPRIFRPNQPVPLGPGISDAQMDAVLQEVPVPAGLCQRLERISLEPRPRFRGRQLALAASVLVAVGLAYAWRSTIFMLTPDPGTSPEIAANQDNALNHLAIETPDPLDEDRSTARDELDASMEELDAERAIDELRWQLVLQANPSIYPPDDVSVPNSPELATPPNINKQSVFAADGTLDSLPELELVDLSSAPQGIAPPLTPGYDLRFRAKYGQNPFVTPANHRDLQTLRVPLVTSTTSYQQAWRALADRKLLPADDVRVEEFLAAVEYDFPAAPAGSVALRTAAGPSPFADPRMRLLQIGVQTGALVEQRRAGTLLCVVVDTSASMRRGGRLAMVRRALADVARQLNEADRVSLVASSDQSKMLVEAAGPDKLSRILAAVYALEPERATNVGAGLEMACSSTLAEQLSAGMLRRVVLVTDGLADVSDEAAQKMASLAANAASNGVALQVLNVGTQLADSETKALEQIARSGGGALAGVADADAIRFALLEALTGRKQVVAREASLKITFNPKSVAAYRLLGHETETLTGSTAAPSAIDLRAGEAATALLELRLNPQGGDDVATVELTWLDAVSGEQRSTRQRVSRLQFAKSFAEAPLALQTAAIVAHAAELLRGSYFVGSVKSMAPVLDLAAQASPLVTERPGMKAFLSFVEQAEKVRTRSAKRP